MKRIICLLLALVMLVGIVPFQVFAEGEPAKPETEVKVEKQKEIVEENQKTAEGKVAKKPEVVEEKTEENKILQNDAKETEELELGNVIPVNQVGSKNSNVSYPLTIKMYNLADKKIEEKTFNSPDELLGQWYKNAGRSDWSYKTFRRIFYGWSTDEKFKEPVNSNIITPNDKIYRDIEPISAVEGLNSDTVLYPVITPWYHENNPKLADELKKFAQMFENISGKFYINNKYRIEANDVIPETYVKKDDYGSKKMLITSYYDPDKEWYGVQAISEFTFSDLRIPFLLTENPLGIVKSAKEVTDFSGKNPQNYTYEDLVVELDEEMEVAKEQKNWTFESSTFIVSAVLDENYQVLNSNITLPSKDNLTTTFSFDNPKGLKKFIIRTTTRNDNSDLSYGSKNSYPTDNILTVKGSELMKPMLLKTGDTTNVKITKEYADTLAKNKELESISKGLINGNVAISETYWMVLYLYLADKGHQTTIRPNTPISEIEAENTINFDFAIPIARFDKNTKEFGDTEEQNLGYSKFVVNKAMDSDGFDKDTQPNKDITKAGEAFIDEKDYKVDETKLDIGGKEYTFKGWNTQADGKGKFAKADTVIEYTDLNQRTNDNVEEDVTLYAIWEAQEKPQPQPEPQAKPEKRSGRLKFNFSTEEIEKHIAYIFGYEDNTVRANGNLTRAEAAAMVTRLAKLDLSNTSKADYKDLEDNAWYLPYINAALKAGMLDAEDNNLRPNENISRGEFAKMLAAVDKDNDYVSNFSDVKGHKYEKEINKIDGNKRIEGYEDGSFRPDAFLTRAEAVTFLNRMYNRVADDLAIESFKNSIAYFKDLNKDDWFYYEIVEASNTHELTRRGSQDKYRREFEKWTNLIK